MIYMKDQVANSNCEELIWYECEGELIICKDWILKDGQISLRRSKSIFDQGWSNGVE